MAGVAVFGVPKAEEFGAQELEDLGVSPEEGPMASPGHQDPVRPGGCTKNPGITFGAHGFGCALQVSRAAIAPGEEVDQFHGAEAQVPGKSQASPGGGIRHFLVGPVWIESHKEESRTLGVPASPESVAVLSVFAEDRAGLPHAVAPPQELPRPAVHPKQCLSVRMTRSWKSAERKVWMLGGF